jgi:hypothetical protein
VGGRVDVMLPVVWIGIGVAAGAGPEEGADSVLRLRDELLELDVEAVEQAVGGLAPARAKGPAGDAVGGLIVTLSDSAVLVALAGVLRSWVGRDRGRKVTISVGEDSLEVTGASRQEQARLIDAWLERHVRR